MTKIKVRHQITYHLIKMINGNEHKVSPAEYISLEPYLLNENINFIKISRSGTVMNKRYIVDVTEVRTGKMLPYQVKQEVELGQLSVEEAKIRYPTMEIVVVQ